MRRPRAASAALALVTACGLSVACTGASDPARPTTSTATRTVTTTRPPTDLDPVTTGSTTAATASSCPFLDKQRAADDVGMRLARITVLRNGGKAVGCRFYALQGSPLSQSERLPGPDQPAIEIASTRYRTAVAAHNGFVRLAAESGTNLQQVNIVEQSPGLCFQTAFYERDKGRDWACAFNRGTTMVRVRTIVTSPALNAILVARAIAANF